MMNRILDQQRTQTHIINNRKVEINKALSQETEVAKNLIEKGYRKLYVGGINPVKTTDEALTMYFSNYGKVFKAYLIYHPITKLSKGFGYVEFETVKDADRVLAFKEHTLDEFKLVIERQKKGVRQSKQLMLQVNQKVTHNFHTPIHLLDKQYKKQQAFEVDDGFPNRKLEKVMVEAFGPESTRSRSKKGKPYLNNQNKSDRKKQMEPVSTHKINKNLDSQTAFANQHTMPTNYCYGYSSKKIGPTHQSDVPVEFEGNEFKQIKRNIYQENRPRLNNHATTTHLQRESNNLHQVNMRDISTVSQMNLNFQMRRDVRNQYNSEEIEQNEQNIYSNENIEAIYAPNSIIHSTIMNKKNYSNDLSNFKFKRESLHSYKLRLSRYYYLL